MTEKTKHKNQRFYQIIFPFVAFLILIIAASVYLISASMNGPLDIRMFGDISLIYLSLLSLPFLLLNFAAIVTLVVILRKAGGWLKVKLPFLDNLFSRIGEGTENICRSSTGPFIFLNSILSVFDKKNKEKG